MKNITMKEIKDNGATFGQFLGFDIYGRIEAEEVVLTASVMYDANSDASVHVAEVSCETMKEAKEQLKEALREIEHSAEAIAEIASQQNFVGTYEDLIERLESVQSDESINVEQSDVVALETAQNAVEEQSAAQSDTFAAQCAAASLAAEQELDAALIDAEELQATEQQQTEPEALPEAIQNSINEIEAMSSIEAQLNAYKTFYIETHLKLIEVTAPKRRRSMASNLAVVNDEIKTTATSNRGEEARKQIELDAMKHMGLTNITFDRRGKYKDWYISATDEHGQEIVQRLDAFKKTLKNAMKVTK